MHWCTLIFSLKGAVTLIVIIVALILSFCSTYFRRMVSRFLGRVPPGPPAFPFIGTVDIDPTHPEESFRKFAARYGSLFSFYFGRRFCVGVGDMNLIRKLFRDERFEGRSYAGIMPHLIGGALTNGIKRIFVLESCKKIHRKSSFT